MSRWPILCRSRAMGPTVLATLLVGLAVFELVSGRHDRPLPASGSGDIALISPTRSLPEDWRRAPGVGRVLAGRLSLAAAQGLLNCPSDLQHVRGVGPTSAGRIAACVQWSQLE